MKEIKLAVTTDGSGDGSATSTESVSGVLYAVQLVDGDYADGVDVTITCEQQDLSIPILVKANFNTDQMLYPRVVEVLNTDGSALGTNGHPLVNGYMKAVVAQGGATKSGSFYCYIVEL